MKNQMNIPQTDILRVKDLAIGNCFLKEHRIWVKSHGGYCIALDNFVHYQTGPEEYVEKVFSHLEITVVT